MGESLRGSVDGEGNERGLVAVHYNLRMDL